MCCWPDLDEQEASSIWHNVQVCSLACQETRKFCRIARLFKFAFTKFRSSLVPVRAHGRWAVLWALVRAVPTGRLPLLLIPHRFHRLLQPSLVESAIRTGAVQRSVSAPDHVTPSPSSSSSIWSRFRRSKRIGSREAQPPWPVSQQNCQITR